ncbi:APC family permease [Candidatus Dependentiae bacterium]
MEKKISLWIAIIININVIIGSAFFIGSGIIAQKSGLFAPIIWLLCGIIILPIVFAFAQLSKTYPEAGGIYIYPKRELGSLWGFISGWGYFISITSGNAIIMHSFTVRFANLLFPNFIQRFDPTYLILDVMLIILFTIFNLANINFLEKAQIIFTSLKAIPILMLIFASVTLFSLENATTTVTSLLPGFVDSIPIVLFGYIGFEICCAISHQIKNGEKNTAKAIIFSFGLIIAIYSILQFLIVGIHGTNTTFPFLELLPKLTNNLYLINFGNLIINLAIMSSYLAAYYGLFYGNNWVLYALGKEKSLPLSKYFTKLNIHKTPWFSVIFQGIITFSFLLITRSTSDLIIMSDFSIIITYILGTISLISIAIKMKANKNFILGILSTLSCGCFLYICFKELSESGIQCLVPFLIIFGIGIVLNQIVNKKKE